MPLASFIYSVTLKPKCLLGFASARDTIPTTICSHFSLWKEKGQSLRGWRTEMQSPQ